MFRKILPLFLICVFLLTAGLGCKGGDKAAQQALQPITLKYWRVFDDEDTFSEMISAYQAIHPHVSIEYRKLRFEEYEDELLNAFAEDRGPDIFSVHSTSIGEYIPKLAPAPASTTLPFSFLSGTIKKEVVVQFQTSEGVTLPYMKRNFVDQVVYDSVWQEKQTGQNVIFGVPLALDTMVLYYNGDILNNAGIPTPPANWTDFQNAVKQIVRFNPDGGFKLIGAPIGTARNVERSTDLLSLLMMQNNTVMETDDRVILFHEMPEALRDSHEIAPGLAALRFYTDFASPVKEVFTWSEDEGDSLEAFVTGRSAFFFGYAYHLPLIQQRSPKLNLGIAKAPQIQGNEELNFANYFLEVVSQKSPNQVQSWDFLKFITSKDVVGSYLEKAKKPTAHRELVLGQIRDEEMGIFASQVLTAKSWYKGFDVKASEEIMKDLIDLANKGEVKLKELLSDTASKVQQTTFKR